MTQTTNGTKGRAAPRKLQDSLRRLVREKGERAAAEQLRVSRQTVSRILAGLSVHNATIDAVAIHLASEL